MAIPATEPKRRFTGGLSRLLKTGYVKNLCKNDYNSLYPSIVLTWNIKSPLDITDVMLNPKKEIAKYGFNVFKEIFGKNNPR